MSEMNRIKSEQLEMSFGKANNILRKSIMFMLVKQCKKDTCYRCKEKIEDIDNFSIEHIEEWLHKENAKDLFFDLNNIAFSHHDCNTKARRRISKTQGKSGLKGVYYDSDKQRNKRWKVIICIEGKNVSFGRFETAEEAGRVYDAKMTELYGENAITNKSLGLL